MYESMTYETILEDMLSRIEDDVDKREGSIIYDAIAPCAFKLAEAYFMLNNFIDLVSGDTAVEEFLDRVVADHGITRKAATYAVRRIETTGKVEIGSRWGLEDTIYTISELIAPNVYIAKCEQQGAIGNTYSGELESIDNLSGITAILKDIIIPGEDKETDDNLRSRFYNKIQAPSTSGNANNYKQWALEVPGVGDAKVFPLWDGPGTVKILVIDENMKIDTGLETKVYEHIEAVRPIGATVTIKSPSEKVINIKVKVTLDDSRTLEEVKEEFVEILNKYLTFTTFYEDTISYAMVGSILMATEGVKDYDELLINNGKSNISINAEEIPAIGTVTLLEE